MGSGELRVKFSDESEQTVAVAPEDTFEDVARRVRSSKGWSDTQNVRFICSGQEMYMQDSVSRASGCVLHCIATDMAHRYTSAKQAYKASEQQHAPAVDWLEVVDPGTVLMWIFGSILALLWLLFVFYAHMFDKTSVVMLCMMTIAFLIPCVLSYVPWLRMLNTPIHTIPPARQQMYYYDDGRGRAQFGPASYAPAGSAAAGGAAGGWSSYGAGIPPRPAARVRGPGSGNSSGPSA